MIVPRSVQNPERPVASLIYYYRMRLEFRPIDQQYYK